MIGAISILVIGLFVPTHEQSTTTSPCPNVFMYEPSGTEAGRWYGVVNLSTDSTLHSLWLNIVLDSKADILGNWIGDVTTSDNTDFKIENTKMKIHPGPAVAVRFFVQYNPLNKAPRLSAIRLNGREICNAKTPQPAIDVIEAIRPDPTAIRPGSDSSRPVIRTERPLDRQTERPIDRPVDRPSNTQTKPIIRPEDKPITKPVFGRPSGDGPVYIPTSNPPIDQSNVNPYSIGGGQVPDQSVIQSRPTFQLTTASYSSSTPDDEDNDSSEADPSEYFNGGQLLVTPVPDSNGHNNRPKSDQCGKVLRNNPNPLVVNGKPTLEGQWPWQIALYQTQTVDSKYICGGTLVSHKHVITAAHCVTRKGSSRTVNKNTLTIYLGKHNLRTSVEGVEIRLVGEITVHPEYNASSFSRDLSILRLRKAVDYTEFIRAACLWPDNQIELNNVIGKKGAVVGWGFDETGVATEELTLVEMPVVDQETCIRSYSEFFARFTSEYTYCAGYRDGAPNAQTGIRKSTSVCNGDSGGGMVFELQGSWYLRGLVSLSVARQNEYRCDPTHYVVFTDLAKFLSWIKQHDQCGKVLRNNPYPLILKGIPTMEGQWPWQIALYQTEYVDNRYICGGTLVSHKHVITAAHCVTRKGTTKKVNKNILTIYLGKHNLRTSFEGVEIRFVEKITVHPEYNGSSFSHDLSILGLRKAVNYTEFIRAACLWPESQVDLTNVIGKKGSVVGWGFDETGMMSETLNLVEMPVVDQETCIGSYSTFFARFTSEYTYCAGYRDGSSVCNGDSGGGMVFELKDSWYLRGLVSISVPRQKERKCDPTHYVVFTDLAKFLSWIKQNLNNY